MFTAILFVCSMLQQDECYMLVDDRGPYETQSQCITRTVEMTKDLVEEILPENFVITGTQCKTTQTQIEGTAI